MKTKLFIVTGFVLLLIIIGGVILAFKWKEIWNIQEDLVKISFSPQNPSRNADEEILTDEEIRQKIKDADAKPENIEYQKSFALALYRHSGLTQNDVWLKDVVRLLTRVYEKNPKDYSTIITLGNVYFEIGESKADNQSFIKAREFYQKALEINPKDIDVQTDLGLTYLNISPPETAQSIIEIEKALKINSSHEKALQNMALAQIKAGKLKEAQEYIKKLREVNPNNEALDDLTSQVQLIKTSSEK